ncbi:6326_t:CDS:2, partial [Racocetra fulgida]
HKYKILYYLVDIEEIECVDDDGPSTDDINEDEDNDENDNNKENNYSFNSNYYKVRKNEFIKISSNGKIESHDSYVQRFSISVDIWERITSDQHVKK